MHRHIKLLGPNTIGVLLLVIAVAALAHAQVGLGLAPMRVELRMAAGLQHSGSLNLSNNSGGKTRVRTELLDFYIDDSATPQFARDYPQEEQYSCRKWLSINPMEMEAEKSTSVQIRYTMHVPEGVPDGSYHCAAGFTTLPSVDKVEGTGMRMAVRIVAAFYVILGNPVIEGGLKQFKLEPVEGADHTVTGWRAVVVLENRGLMYFRPTGKLEVLNAQGEVLETEDFQSNPVLPKREQRFLFPLKVALTEGQYTLRARVDIGTGEIQEGRAVVSTGVAQK